MIEFLLGSIVFPIARKIGEKWIDRVAKGLDEKLISLMKSATTDPSKEDEVIEYLRNNPNSEKKLTDNVTGAISAEDTVASLAATIVPSRGAKLAYYSALINWLTRTGAKLGQHFVLKGFFHGELFLSYFIFGDDIIGDSDVMSNINDNYLTSRLRFDIYVEKAESEAERDNKFRTINRKAKLSRFGGLDHGDYGSHQKIKEIHEYYVLYDRMGLGSDDYLKLPEELQDELEIKDNAPIPLMILSLRELLGDRIKEVEDLSRTIRNV